MTTLTKFLGAKLAIVGASVLATVAIWVALAWPQWNAGADAQDASAAAEAPATASAPESVPPPRPQTPVIIRRVYIVKRSSAPASPPVQGSVAAAPPPEFSQVQPSSSAPQRSQPHPMPITRSRGS